MWGSSVINVFAHFQAGNCTLREAVILASVLAKCSIPMLHSAAAILKIAEMDYNGANSIFLKTLLDKKYALPYRVVDAVVFHFLGYVSALHQSLINFLQSVYSVIKHCLLKLLILVEI